jgi:hypothetical protein
MHAEQNENASRMLAETKARFRMALWLLVFYLITLIWAYLTYPFLGFKSTTENVFYGIWVASPFWITIIATLVSLHRRMRG